jgi:hypothetical protein
VRRCGRARCHRRDLAPRAPVLEAPRRLAPSPCGPLRRGPKPQDDRAAPKRNAHRTAEKEHVQVKRENAQIQERLRRADIIIEAPDSWLPCSSRCVRRPSRAGATNHRREGDRPGGRSAAHLRDLRGAPGDRVPVVKAERLSGAARPVRALSEAGRAQVLSLPAASASWSGLQAWHLRALSRRSRPFAHQVAPHSG